MAQEIDLTPDQKGIASFTMGDVVRRTINNFPEERFRPHVFRQTDHYTIAGIDPHPYKFWPTADGIGTKPELAERLFTEDSDPNYFENLAYDTFAMIDGDWARFGVFLVGIAEVLDMNSADLRVVAALGRGAQKAANEGRFPVLNGETAELGYRTAGYGDTRVNWNAVGVGIFNENKLMLGDRLEAGQPVVAFRETSIRSNGLSKARKILESAFLHENHRVDSKESLVALRLRQAGFEGSDEEILRHIQQIMGSNILEHIQVPWHRMFHEETRQLLLPSRLYGPIIYDAQGGVEGERKVDMVAAAHITGGGIPEKGMRMVKERGLGMSLDSVFPDPEAVISLMKVVQSLPEGIRQKIDIDERVAIEQWNSGIGFLVAVSSTNEAKKLIDIAASHECEARVAGEITPEPKIQFRGFSWN